MKSNNKNTISRYLFIVILASALGLSIIGKAAYEAVVHKDYWEVVRKRLASKQRNIPAIRGNIYSADGQLLVGSMPVYSLRADFVVRDPNDSVAERRTRLWRDSAFVHDLDSLCLGLHELFPEHSAEEYRQKLLNGKRTGDRKLLIARRVSYIKYREFLKLPYVHHGRIQTGFYGEEIPQRQKPYGNLANRTLGSLMTTSDTARNGLELAYDSILRGINGKYHREKVRQKWTDRIDVEPINGLDLITTIDVGMQDAAETILKRQLQNLNAEVGVVVLMEVKTGDVKAITSLTRIAPGEYYEVKNNAITDLWEPGSTFKTASMMVALEDGVIHRGQTIDTGNGQWPMHGRVMKDHNWRKGGYGTITVDECLMFSSNVGVSRFIDENYKDHPEKFVDGLHREGVGLAFDLPFPGSGRPNVRRPKPNDPHWYKTTLPWMSIGYETQIPPIYTATFYNAIANNGCMVKPRFVRAIEKDGEILKEFPVEVVKQRICSPKTLRDIHEILERVVNDPKGLGKKAGCKQFKVCGKTGTAQVADAKGSYHSSPARYMVSFAGFYPSEAPKYTCVVCILKSGSPASGGGQAGPVFRELAKYVMSKGSYRPVTDAADSTSVFEAPAAVEMPDTVAGIVPNVIGLGVRQAVALLESQNLKVRVHGQGRVAKQSIFAGNKAVEGQTIEIHCNLTK